MASGRKATFTIHFRHITQEIGRILCPKSKPLSRLSIQAKAVAALPSGPVIFLDVEHNFAVAETALLFKERQ